jgi:hypothetical protein
VARKKLVEHNALVQAVEMGLSKVQIMEKFGIKSPAALKVAYFDALAALDKITNISKGRQSQKVDNKISVNSRGSLVIPKKLVDYLGLDKSDTYEVVKTGSDILVKKVKKPPKTILRKKSGRSTTL